MILPRSQINRPLYKTNRTKINTINLPTVNVPVTLSPIHSPTFPNVPSPSHQFLSVWDKIHVAIKKKRKKKKRKRKSRVAIGQHPAEHSNQAHLQDRPRSIGLSLPVNCQGLPGASNKARISSTVDGFQRIYAAVVPLFLTRGLLRWLWNDAGRRDAPTIPWASNWWKIRRS